MASCATDCFTVFFNSVTVVTVPTTSYNDCGSLPPTMNMSIGSISVVSPNITRVISLSSIGTVGAVLTIDGGNGDFISLVPLPGIKGEGIIANIAGSRSSFFIQLINPPALSKSEYTTGDTYFLNKCTTNSAYVTFSNQAPLKNTFGA